MDGGIAKAIRAVFPTASLADLTTTKGDHRKRGTSS